MRIVYLILIVIFIYLISSVSVVKPTPIYNNNKITVALNSIYVYRGIKTVNVILTIHAHDASNINVRNMYVQYSDSGRKHKLNIHNKLIACKKTYYPEEYKIVLDENSLWDWSRPNKIARLTLEVEYNGNVFNVTNTTGGW